MRYNQKWLNELDQIIYINMDSSTERNERFKIEFEPNFSHNRLTRIPAITPATIGVDVINDMIQENAFKSDRLESYLVREPFIKSKEIEVCLSLGHALAIEEAIRRFRELDQNLFLIAEDDAINHGFDTEEQENNFVQTLKYADFDLMYAGYLAFTKNINNFLLQNEYCIKSKMIDENVITADKGFFGTYGYIIQITDANVEKFERLVREFRKGSISDFCLSEQRYLRKRAFIHKPIMCSGAESTIDQSQHYNAVFEATKVNVFDEGYVENSRTYDRFNMVASRHETSRTDLMYFVQLDNCGEVIDTKFRYIGLNSKATIDMWIEEFKHFTVKNQNVDKAFYVIFDDVQRPNRGRKTYVKNSTT